MEQLAIVHVKRSSTTDPQTLALGALGWVLADARRADRLLGLTGLTPDALRSGLGHGAVLGAVLEFLASHEPDLLSAAEELGVAPEELVHAAKELSR